MNILMSLASTGANDISSSPGLMKASKWTRKDGFLSLLKL